MSQPVIDKILPGAGVEGGEVTILCKDFRFSNFTEVKVRFAGIETRPICASVNRIIAPIPANIDHESGNTQVTIEANGGESSAVDFIIGHKLAENLHPVANPAYDRDNGAIYTTLSGSRGQKVPVSVYKITPDGESEPFLTDVVNPTG